MELIKEIQLIKIARAHYIENKPKNQIAEEFNISRFKAARLIDEAVNKGIVKFIIPELEGLRTDLSEQLEQKYQLNHCIVVATPELPAESLVDSLSSAGANILKDLITSDTNVGIASGKVISELADKLDDFAKCNLIQAAGVQEGMNFKHSSLEIVHRLAALGAGKAYPLMAPMWLEKIETVQHLMTEPTIIQLHSLYNQLDVLITGIGAWYGEGCSGMLRTIPEKMLQEVQSANATADLCSIIINADGDPLTTTANELNIALKAEQMRKIPEIIAIAGGTDKYKAIQACLAGQWITTLVTDEGTANYLLKEDINS